MTDNTDPRVEAAWNTLGLGGDWGAVHKDDVPKMLAAADAVAQTEPVAWAPANLAATLDRRGFATVYRQRADVFAITLPLYAAPPRPDNADLVERLIKAIRPYTRATLFVEELREEVEAALHPTEGRQG